MTTLRPHLALRRSIFRSTSIVSPVPSVVAQRYFATNPPRIRSDNAGWINANQVYEQFSDNVFVTSAALPSLDVMNPATQTIVASIAETTADEFQSMLQKSSTAFDVWKTVPVQQRQRIMLEYQRLIRLATPELADLITLEQGKTVADAKGDVFRGLEVVETACQVAPYLLGDSLAGISSSMVRMCEIVIHFV
jgi:hypothetical protein